MPEYSPVARQWLQGYAGAEQLQKQIFTTLQSVSDNYQDELTRLIARMERRVAALG